ncbi:MAG: DUF6273 domain-containing protein [Clostridiales bacterium]|nr:DUF6273 domain-containing protein [Clostridiales bacterium]
MKSKRRILSLLLAVCILAGLIPTASFAAGTVTSTGKAIQLVNSSNSTGGISGYDSTNGYNYIYYGYWTAPDEYTTSGPIKWRVLDTKTNMENSEDGDGLFLLSDVLLGSGSTGGVYFDSSSPYSNAWQGSDAQSWCNDFAGISGSSVTDAFSSTELAAILATTKSDGSYSDFFSSDSILNDDKIFFLSAEETENSSYGFSSGSARIAKYGTSACVWWLRSPYLYTYDAGVAFEDYGDVSYSYVYYAKAARPAFNLNLESVLFTSAVEGGKKSSVAAGADAISEIADYSGSEWKLTLLDSSRAFAVTESTAEGQPGETITLNYTGATVYDATSAPNEYISVIIADSDGAQYYGRVAQPTSENGTVQITIPSGLAYDTYTLYVFSEQYNGSTDDDTKLTDYASALSTVSLTVAPDTTAPVLSAGTVTRASDSAATVSFTSDEAGTFYYAIVNNGETEPTIDTTGTGTDCGTTEQTISLTDLTAGAKDIYIVVKDAAGNVSDALKITIPAADSSVTTAPTANTLTYTGTAQELVTAGEASNGTMYYSTDNSNWSTDIPAGTGAATYTVYYKVVGDDNHNDYTPESNSVSVTIGQATQSISYAATSVSITTDNEGFTNDLTKTLVYGDISYASSDTSVATVDSDGKVAVVGEGTAIITATASGSDNYTSATASYTLTIMELTELPEQEFTDGLDHMLLIKTGLDEVPDGLKNIETLDTVDEIISTLKSVLIKQCGYPEGNTIIYDVTLMVSDDGGATWQEATASNFPADGLTIVLPYPDGTGKDTHDFAVTHMFTTTDFGNTPGDTENLAVTKTDDGIKVTVTGLSPIAVAWTDISEETGSFGTSENTGSAATGDETNILLWIVFMLLAASGITVIVICGRKRKCNR